MEIIEGPRGLYGGSAIPRPMFGDVVFLCSNLRLNLLLFQVTT